MSDLKTVPPQRKSEIYRFDYSGLDVITVEGGAEVYRYVRLPPDDDEETIAGAPPVVRLLAVVNTPNEN
jgi:hypothetical protein